VATPVAAAQPLEQAAQPLEQAQPVEQAQPFDQAAQQQPFSQPAEQQPFSQAAQQQPFDQTAQQPYSQPMGQTGEQAAPQPPYQQAPQDYQTPAGYQAPAERKSKIAAGLLAIFLGSLGIHKFYLGFTKPGIIYLCISVIGGIITFGIVTGVMGTIALVEGILYLTKSDEEFYQLYEVQKKQWF